MRTLKLLGIITLLLGLIQPGVNAERWALLIGIKDYAYPGIRDLRGCETDVELMRDALIRFGFEPENMKFLRSREATRDAIVSAFKEWLIEKPKPGDVVVFYFSGHGSRVVDESGDEADGWDELLCPADLIPSANRERYLNALLDDELGNLLNQIPTENVTVILDSCHSGTGTKALIDAGLTIPKSIDLLARDLTLVRQKPGSRPASQRESISLEGTKKNHVLISGSAAAEVSLDAMWEPPEGEPYYAGVLTKNLIDALDKVMSGTRYVDLEPEVLQGVRKRSPQTPQFEGDVDRPIFSARNTDGTFTSFAASEKPFVSVSKVEGDLVTVNAGSTRGVTKGSVYEIFSPIEVTFAGEPLATMRITAVDQRQSSGKVLNLQSTIQRGGRAVESSHAYPPDRLYLQILIEGDFPQDQNLEDAFSKITDLVVVGQGKYADLVLKVQMSETHLTGSLIAVNGSVMGEVTTSSAVKLAEKFKPNLENAFVIKKLANLENPNPPFKIEVWMDKGKNPVYQIGEAAVFKFKSQRNCYLTLLDVDTQGHVTMLFPNKYHPTNEIVADETYTIPSADMKFTIKARAPAGKELIKAIATTVPTQISEFDLNQTKDIFLDVGGADEVRNFTKGLGRAFVVEREEPEPEVDAGPADITHLPTSKFVTSELIAEIR